MLYNTYSLYGLKLIKPMDCLYGDSKPDSLFCFHLLLSTV